MATYIVTSDRLAGFKRGDELDAKDIDGDIERLIEAGHISPQASKKSAKTKDTDTAKD
jgi:hypothetical protein